MTTRNITVSLWSRETIISRRPVVIEVPDDATDEEIKELDSDWLNSILDVTDAPSWWDAEDFEDFEVLDEVEVHGDADGDDPVELQLVRNVIGELALCSSMRDYLVEGGWDILVRESDCVAARGLEKPAWTKEGF
jgi:hypothetical protein